MSLPACRRAANLLAALYLLLPALCSAAASFSRLWWLNESHTPVQVNDLVRDRRGFLWLATDAGVYRFNGTGFLHLRDSGGAVTSLYQSTSGMLAGYRSGRIARVVDDSMISIPVPGGGPGAAVTSFACWGDVIAFSTLGSGIWALHHGQVLKFTSARGLSDDYVYRILIPRRGEMLAATDRGLNRLYVDSGKLKVTMLPLNGIVQALRLWPGQGTNLRDGFLAGLNEGRWYGFRPNRQNDLELVTRDSLPAPAVDFALQNGRVIVLADNNRAYRYERGHATLQARRDSVRLDHGGACLQPDASGTLWIGTGSGLEASSGGYLERTVPAPGYRLGSVTALACSGDTRWYGQSDTLVTLSSSGVSSIRRLPGQITTLTADTSGLWIGTLGAGLLYLDKHGLLSRPRGAEAFSGEHVLSLTIHSNRLWMATLNGLDELEISPSGLRRVRHHTKQGGLGADYVYQCYPDRQGRIWIATDGAGICCYDGKTYRRWTDGQAGFRGRTIYSITEDAAGQIWAATLEQGICRYDGKRWTSIGRAEGLQSLNVTSLATLSDGQVLVVHDQGMDVWQPANGAFRHIGRRQGMDIDSSSRMLNCAARLPGGGVTVPYEDGFLDFLPGAAGAAVDPGLRLLGVAVPGRPESLTQQDFSPEENSLSFRFEGSNLLNFERLFYRYRLRGFMKSWILTRDESASFARLPPGDYVFEVQAAYSPAFTHPAAASFHFSVESPLWMRWWVISLAILALAAVALLVIRIRERNIRRIEQLQNARIQMEYEHLKSQINPHFLFNSLNILGTLIGKDADRAKEYTFALSDLYRNTLHYRDKDLIPLEEEWGILMQYILVQQTRFGAALAIDADIPAEVLRKARVVPLALQLLVENAIKHNVVAASSPLTITIVADGEWLRVSNPFRPKRNPERGTGIGLANIRSRYGLFKRDIRYGLTKDIFIVELPLL